MDESQDLTQAGSVPAALKYLEATSAIWPKLHPVGASRITLHWFSRPSSPSTHSTVAEPSV